MSAGNLLSRRRVLQAGVAASGGLLVSCRAADALTTATAQTDAPASAAAAKPATPAAFGAYVEIAPHGLIHITCPSTEMGQGVYDALPRILAEELDADWQAVRIRIAPAGDAFVNPITKRQRTANSESVVIHYELLRRAGAAARELLVSAAARQWGVPTTECTTSDAQVTHAPSARTISYAAIASAAAQLPSPSEPKLKSAADFKLIGRRAPNKSIPAKCDGSAQFGLDVRLPNMLYAALARSPAVAAKVVSFDATAARAMPGVIDMVAIADGVAVLASSTWQAFKAAEAVQVVYDTAAAASVDQVGIEAQLRAGLDDDAKALPGRRANAPPYDRAATEAALQAAAKRLTFEYEVPFVAHAALEPLCCTAQLTGGKCEVWAPSQQPDRARDAVAEIVGLPKAQVTLHVTLLGGGFGRKWELDFIRQTAEIAKHAKGRPVKLTWTREQDFRHDRFRSAHRVRTRVGLDRAGRVVGIHSRSVGIDMWKYQRRPPLAGFGDPFATGLLINDAYGFANPYVDFVALDLPVPVGTWRSVSASMNGFFAECAVDDIAAATTRDPYELRREWLAHVPRAVAVLEIAADKAGWGTQLPRGRGRGIAVAMGFGSFCAEVVEVSVRGRKVKVEKIVCAFDCGTIIDPSMLAAQIEGGVVWGLSAARDGQIRFASGAAIESNFHDAPILRLPDCPHIEVHLVSNGETPGGAGEASVPPVAPALAGAIYAATGKRPRRLPLIADGWEFG